MDTKELTDDALMTAIKSVCDFDAERAEKWRPEALAIGRAVERAVRATIPSDAAQAPQPVAVIGSGWQLCYVGSGPLAPIVERHGLKIGDKLYAAPVAPAAAAREHDDPQIIAAANKAYAAGLADGKALGELAAAQPDERAAFEAPQRDSAEYSAIIDTICATHGWRRNKAALIDEDEIFRMRTDDAVALWVQARATAPQATALSKDSIREIFTAHGFTIKEGQTDLKQYVYDAAYALLARAAVPQATVKGDTPFANCSFRHCDLPGQCKAEGACHHPARAAVPQAGAKSVATVRVTHGGYGMALSTYIAYALPEGTHELYAAAPVQAGALTDEQRKAVEAAVHLLTENDLLDQSDQLRALLAAHPTENPGATNA